MKITQRQQAQVFATLSELELAERPLLPGELAKVCGFLHRDTCEILMAALDRGLVECGLDGQWAIKDEAWREKQWS